MKIINDKIQFEYRQEIHDTIKALKEYQQNHKAERNETVQELIDKLDVMDMTW